MSMSINTNVASLTAQRAMINSNSALETAFERLSTGQRVNSASDDAAGLSVGTRMESRVSGLNQAIRNTNDGISMVQIAEGALDEVTTILQRMRDLAVQAANGSMGTQEITYLKAEHDKLASSLDSVIGAAQFNGTTLINSSNTGNTIQIGAGSADTMTVTIDGVSASGLSVDSSSISYTASTAGDKEETFIGINLGTASDVDTYVLTVGSDVFTAATGTVYDSLADLATELNRLASATVTVANTDGGITVNFVATGAQTDTAVSLAQGVSDGGNSVASIGSTIVTTQGVDQSTGPAGAITTIDAALNQIASDRASLGASQQQLESTVRNLANVAENMSAAVGRIMDTDYAAETANLTKSQILQQAATSILAQANAQPQNIMALLR